MDPTAHLHLLQKTNLLPYWGQNSDWSVFSVLSSKVQRTFDSAK